MNIINVMDLLRIKHSILKHIDKEIINHGMETAYISYMIGKELGYSKNKLQQLVMIAILHDIGTYKTEELNKIKKFEFIGENNHSVYGYGVLKHYKLLNDMSSAVLYHHHSYSTKDKYIEGINIPDEAFLIGLCDRISIICNLLKFNEENIYEYIYIMDKSMFNPKHIKILYNLLHNKDLINNIVNNKYKPIITNIIKEIDVEIELIKEYLILLPISIDMYSDQTALHTVSVASASRFISQKIKLNENYIEKIEIAAYLHDIGKVCTPKNILEKEGKLTDSEFKNMKNHVFYSKQILQDANIDKEIIDLACNHHEKLDGSGYCQGLIGQELTIGDKIVAISDIFCALTEKRHYKEAFNKTKVIEILDKMVQANHIDSEIVDVVYKNYDELLKFINNDKEVYTYVLNNISQDYNYILNKINNIGMS